MAKPTNKTTTTTTTGNVNKQWAILAKWPTKLAGVKPTNKQLAQAIAWGNRPGAMVTLAVALYLRPQGATQAQVGTVCGGPQLNVWRTMLASHKARNGNKALASKVPGAKPTAYTMRAGAGKAKAKAKARAKAKQASPATPATPAIVTPGK